jgi:hypothetical protein
MNVFLTITFARTQSHPRPSHDPPLRLGLARFGCRWLRALDVCMVQDVEGQSCPPSPPPSLASFPCRLVSSNQLRLLTPSPAAAGDQQFDKLQCLNVCAMFSNRRARKRGGFLRIVSTLASSVLGLASLTPFSSRVSL